MMLGDLLLLFLIPLLVIQVSLYIDGRIPHGCDAIILPYLAICWVMYSYADVLFGIEHVR